MNIFKLPKWLKIGWSTRLWKTKREIAEELQEHLRGQYTTLCTNCGEYSTTQYFCSVCGQRIK